MAAIWLDVYAHYIRLSEVTQSRSEGLALANWVLYLARIFIMTSSFALAFIFESKQSVRFSELILVGFVLGTALIFVFVRYQVLEVLIRQVAGFVLFMPARGLAQENYFWRPLGAPKISHLVTSTCTCLFLNIGIFLPFVMTKLVPEYRMSAVYAGQFVNFMSTLLVMLYADPVMMRGRDAQISVGGLDGFIWGRLLANLLIAVFFVVWVGYWA
jgi:hypothetical protein